MVKGDADGHTGVSISVSGLISGSIVAASWTGLIPRCCHNTANAYTAGTIFRQVQKRKSEFELSRYTTVFGS
ncbi:MAG: hypothetical protein O3B86_01010, partial [Planctomycetota bacterium]|nr:hypothetical protein [Planctomycetota bacterium]